MKNETIAKENAVENDWLVILSWQHLPINAGSKERAKELAAAIREEIGKLLPKDNVNIRGRWLQGKLTWEQKEMEYKENDTLAEVRKNLGLEEK